MTLRFEIFGVELARVTLDIERIDHAPNLDAAALKPRVFVTAVERGVKAVSKQWIKRMITG